MPDVNTNPVSGIELRMVDKSVSPETESKIAGITDFPSIANQDEMNEDTTINDKNRHRKPTIGDPPSFTLTVYHDSDETPQNDLESAKQNQTENDFRVVDTNVSPEDAWEFKAYVQSITTPYGSTAGFLQKDVTFQLNENDQGDIITKNPSA